MALSKSGDQLIVGRGASDGDLFCDVHLYIYTTDGYYVDNVTLPDGDVLWDAAWTPQQGHIVYTTRCVYSAWCIQSKVVVMSRSGDVIASTNMTNPGYLSVSMLDDVIYVTAYESGVYQSTDDGLTWSHVVFNSTDGWSFEQAIKVSTDHDQHTDDLWTLEFKQRVEPWEHNNRAQRLRVYTVDRRRAADDGGGNDNLTWRDAVLPSPEYEELRNIFGIKLAFDGHGTMIVADQLNGEVYAWSVVSGKYDRQLMSPLQTNYNKAIRMAVNSDNHVMYVGNYYNGIMSVFSLIYESSTDL